MKARKLSILFCSVLIIGLLQGCGNSKEDKKAEEPQATVEQTVEPTNTPLPTAEVSVSDNSNGTSQVNNATAGYNVSYDNKLLEMSNTDSTISFAPSNKKAKKELNLFLTITEIDSSSVKELGKQLKKSYKKFIEKEKVILGASKTNATCYTLTDNKKVTHQVYTISSEEKGWYIELKCPSKYEKNYLTAFEDILNSMDFSATIAE